jgi:hypothetical protein
MHKTELKKEIDTLIDSIKKQADRMNTEINFSKVELEVFHHKIQKLYEKSILIHHLPAEEEKPILKPAPVPEFIPAPEPRAEVPAPKESPPAPVAVKSAELPKPEQVTKVPADLFGHAAQPDPKNQIKSRTEKEAAQQSSRKAIPDLKSAISINDKFRLINELFEGNATEFNVALSQINNCPTFEEADIYVSNIRDIYKWPEEKESVLLFLDLVERRFL